MFICMKMRIFYGRWAIGIFVQINMPFNTKGSASVETKTKLKSASRNSIYIIIPLWCIAKMVETRRFTTKGTININLYGDKGELTDIKLSKE